MLSPPAPFPLGKTAGKGDIVLFNNPNPRSPQTSVGNREVFISRVVGVPGDTLMLNDELWVTDEQVLSPDSKSLYVYSHTEEETMQAAMQQVNIQGNRLVGMVQEVKANVFTNSTRMTAVSIAFIHTGIQGMRMLRGSIYVPSVIMNITC